MTFNTDKNGHIDFKEFLLAIDFASSEKPEEKLKRAFRYVLTIYITVLVTRGRHFGARESV
jgi:hypothetical protein